MNEFRTIVEAVEDTRHVAEYQKNSDEINKFARKKNSVGVTPSLSNRKVSQTYDGLRKAIRRSPVSKEDTVLHHGTDVHPHVAGSSGVIRTDRFLSTSKDEGTSTSHALQRAVKSNSSEGHVLHIGVPKGTRSLHIHDANNTAHANHENEHLIADQAKVKVDKTPFKVESKKVSIDGKSHTKTINHWNATLTHDGVSKVENNS